MAVKPAVTAFSTKTPLALNVKEDEMARRIVESMVDDLTGETIEPGKGGTLEFTVGGATYSIDLTEKNAEEFYAVLGKYMQAGTRVGRATRAAAGNRSGRIAPGPSGTPSRADLQAMRSWAREQGLAVSDRGRVPAAIQEAYRRAQMQ